MFARHLRSPATSEFSEKLSEMPKSTTSHHHPSSSNSSSSSSLSSARYKEIWNYLWIPVLISLSKELIFAKAHQSILLPSEEEEFRVQVQRLSSSCPARPSNLYFRPVIGILSHPGDGASGRLNNGTNASYIAASYVKFVEAAGARVIPLIYNEPPEVLAEKLTLVNGVLLTGGWAKTGLYFETVQRIFKQVLEKNDAGDHFPLYAICLGFELLNMIISQDDNILEKFRATDQASTLQFVKSDALEGTVFERFPPELIRKLRIDCLVMQNHQVVYRWLRREALADGADSMNSTPPLMKLCKKLADPAMGICEDKNVLTMYTFKISNNYRQLVDARFCQHNYMVQSEYGVSPERFLQNNGLSRFFNILTTSTDAYDKVYVSTIQARNYPVTAFQWHPEKNAFEWGLSMIPHSEDAIQVTQHVANYLISEARRSLNRPAARDVLDNLIYNFSPTYCGKAGKGYDEVYIFA